MRDGQGFLFVDLWANTRCPKAGDTVIARAMVQNKDQYAEVIELKDRPVFDVSIAFNQQGGSLVKSWSDGKPLTPELTRIELKPGESRTIEVQAVVSAGVRNTGVAASFITGARFVDHPIKPYMPLDDCSLLGY